MAKWLNKISFTSLKIDGKKEFFLVFTEQKLDDVLKNMGYTITDEQAKKIKAWKENAAIHVEVDTLVEKMYNF
jgi:hypothetical protein